MKAYQILLVENFYDKKESESKWAEKLVCELGASDSTHSGKALDPVFTTKLDGTHTLTFDLPRYCLDTDTGENVLNELADLVANKSKIIYREWKNEEDKQNDNEGANYTEFHFVVNERADARKGEEITYSFSCMDSFIEELSKTGYGLTFTGELGQNGLGTIHELAEIVLKDSGWEYEAKDKFYEYDTKLEYNIDQARYNTIKVAKPVHKVKWVKPLERYCYLLDKEKTSGLAGNKQIYCYEDSEQITANTVKNIIYNADHDNGTFTDVSGWTSCKVEESEDGAEVVAGHLVMPYQYKKDNQYRYSMKIEQITSENSDTSFLINDTAAMTNETLVANTPYLLSFNFGTSTKGKIKSFSIFSKNPLSNPDLLIKPWEKSDYYAGFADEDNFGQGVDSNGWVKVIKPSINISTPYFVFEIETEGKGKAIYLYSIKLIKVTGKAGEGEDAPSAEDNYLEVLGQLTNQKVLSSGNEIMDKICTQTEGASLSAYTNHSFQYVYFEGEENIENLRNISAAEIFGTISTTEGDIEKRDPPQDAEGNIDTTTVFKDKYGRHYQYYYVDLGDLKEDWQPGGSWGPAYLGDGKNDKRRTLKAEKSNRFNLIQELAELFKVWPVFNTKDRKISFREGHLKQNFSGFHYGVNLESLQRKQDSETLVTKIIVEDVSNDYAENGFVTIRTARDNPWGENYFYNFKHYVDQKLLSHIGDEYDEKGIFVKKDLQVDIDCRALYKKVKGYNSNIFNANEKLATLKVDYSNVISESKSLEYAMSGINERVISLKADLKNKNISKPDKDKINVSLDQYEYSYSKYKEQKTLVEERKATLEEDIKKLEKEVNNNQQAKVKLINAFEQKYLPFIKEGTWTDSSYADNNAYYYDAQKISQTSAVPHTSWSISVFDASVLDEMEEFEMQVGDQTILVDNDFFGIENNPTKNHVFEVLISSISEHLEEPSKNAIEVRNYLTSFDDLFQRIAATTQTVETKEQIFDKAANFTDDHQIDQSILQNTLLGNSLILANASDNSYTLDSNGLSLQSIVNPAKKARILAEGMFFSNSTGLNGMPEWKTGITADGINASLLTAGEINTSLVKILSNGQPSFVWNELGISAYAPSDVIENYGKVAVIGDSYSVTGNSLTVKEEDGTGVFVQGWVDELKTLLGKDKIISAYPNGGLGSTGFSPWYYPDYGEIDPNDRNNNRAMRFIDQLERILSNLDSNNEEYPEYILVCGGFNDKTWCVNDLSKEQILNVIDMTNPVLSEYASSEETPSYPIVELPLKDGDNNDLLTSGYKELNSDDRLWSNLSNYKNIEDFLAIKNDSLDQYLYENLAIHDQDSSISDDNYLILNGKAYNTTPLKNNNKWLKERSYGQLILRMRYFNETVEKKYSQKGQRKPKIILVSAGRYAKRNSSLGYLDYTNTINEVLLKHTYEIYQLLAKKLNWEYHDISGIIRIPSNVETWKDVSWTNGEENYIKNKEGLTDWVHPSTQGNQKIAKLLSQILERSFSSDADYETGNILFLGDSYTRNYDCLVRENNNYVYKDDTVLYKIKEKYTEKDFLKGWPEVLAEKYELSANQFIDLGIGSSAFLPVDKNTKWKLYKHQLRNFTSRLGLFNYNTNISFEDDVDYHALNIEDSGRWNYYYDYRNPTYEKLKDLDLEKWLDGLNYIVIGGGYNERVYFSDLEYWGKRPQDTIPSTNNFSALETEVRITKREIAFLQRLKLQREYERKKQEDSDLIKTDFLAKATPMQCFFVIMGKRQEEGYNINTGLERIYSKLKEYWTATGAESLISSTGFTEPEIGENEISVSEAYSLCNFKIIDISNEEWKSNGSYAADGIHPSAMGILNIARILSEEKRIFGAKKEIPQSYNGNYFTRFDSFGLYTIKNPIDYSFNYSEAGGIFRPWFEGLSREECIRRIQEESLVSLTEKGFSLNVPGSKGSIKLGYEKTSNNSYYGLYINDENGNLIVQLHNNADTNKISGWNISSDGLLHIGDSSDDKKKKVYSLSNKKRTASDTKEIALAIGEIENGMADAKNFSTASFKVMDDGSLLASEAIISGSGIFSGAIKAESGQIGAFSIRTDVPDTLGRFDNMICIGDSYAIAGDEYKYGVNQRGWPEELSSMLGTKKLYKKGQGSSGFSTGVNKVTISDYKPLGVRSLLWMPSNSTYYHTSGTVLGAYIKETGDNDSDVTKKIGEKMESIPQAVKGLTSNFYNPVKKTLYYKSSSGWSKFVFSSENKMTQSVFNAIKNNPLENAAIQGITKPGIQKYYYYEQIWLRGEKGIYQGFPIEDFFNINNTNINRHKIYLVPGKEKFYYYEDSTWKSENYKNFVHNSTNEKREIEIILTRTQTPTYNPPPEPIVMWYNSDDNAYWYQAPLSEKWVKAPARVALEQVGHRDKKYSLASGAGYFYYNSDTQEWVYQSGSTTNLSPLANDPDTLKGTFSYYVHRYYTSNYLYAETVKISGYNCLQVTQHYSPTNFLVDANNPYVSKNKYFDVPISGYYFYYDTSATRWSSATISSYEKLLPYIQNYTYLLKSLDTEIENKEEIKSIVVCGGYVDRAVNSGSVTNSTIPIQIGFLDFWEYAREKYPQAIIYIFFVPHNEGEYRDTLNNHFKNYVYPAYRTAYETIGGGERDLIKLYDISTQWAHTPSKDMQKDKMHPSLLGSMKIASSMESFLINKTGVFYGQVVDEIGSSRVSSGFSFQGIDNQDVSFWAGYSGSYEPYEDDFDATEAPFYTTYGGKVFAKQGRIAEWRFCEDPNNTTDSDFQIPSAFKTEVSPGLYNFDEWDSNDISLKGRIDLVNISPKLINFGTKSTPVCEYSGSTPVKVSKRINTSISIQHFLVPYVTPAQTNSGMGYIEWDKKSRVWAPGLCFSGDNDQKTVLYTIEGALFLFSREGGIQRIG